MAILSENSKITLAVGGAILVSIVSVTMYIVGTNSTANAAMVQVNRQDEEIKAMREQQNANNIAVVQSLAEINTTLKLMREDQVNRK